MKRICCLAIAFGFLVSVQAFSKSESWTYGGVEYSNAFETTGTGTGLTKSTLTSVGMNLSDFTFWNGSNVGLYIHDGVLFPISESITTSSGTVRVDLSSYSYLVATSIIIGPGIRFPLSKSIALMGGLGIHALQLSGNSSGNVSGYGNVTTTILAWNLGLGADFGMKLDLGNVVFFATGISAVYDLLNNSTISSSVNGTASGWAENYSFFGIDPFLCIGINIYQHAYGFGKPK